MFFIYPISYDFTINTVSTLSTKSGNGVDSKVIGYGIYEKHYICTLEIFKQYRKKGYGKILVTHIENKLTEMYFKDFPKKKVFRLFFAIKPPSIEFWKKCGYKVIVNKGFVKAKKSIRQ